MDPVQLGIVVMLVVGHVAVLLDYRSARRRWSQALADARSEAFTDELTGLLNRRD